MQRNFSFFLLMILSSCALNGMEQSKVLTEIQSFNLSEEEKESLILKMQDRYPVTSSSAFAALQKKYASLNDDFFNQIKEIDSRWQSLDKKLLPLIYKKTKSQALYVLLDNSYKDGQISSFVRNETEDFENKMRFTLELFKLYAATRNYLQECIDNSEKSN